MSIPEKSEGPLAESDDGRQTAVPQPTGGKASRATEKDSQVAIQGPLDRVKNFLLSKFSSFNIGHLLLMTLGLHLFAMSFPNGNTDYVFDEAYYVPASNDLLNLIPSNLEHPFFGKIWGAMGIHLFGNDFFGWRIFYVIIGVLSVWALYELALIFFSREKALFAASMLAFETLFFIHTSLLLLEGPPVLFALLGFLAYFKRHYYWSAAAFGLSILSKEWGIYFVAALVLYHLWATNREPLARLFSGLQLKHLLVFIAILFLVVSIPLWVYDGVYHPYKNTHEIVSTELIVQPNGTTITTTKTSTNHSGYISNPIETFIYYYSYHSSLRISPSDLNDSWDHLAWNWILPFKINPSQYFVTTVTVTTTSSNGTVLSQTYLHPIDWLGIGNLVVWYSIWIIVPVLAIKVASRKVTQLDALVGAWIAGTYIPNLLLSGVFQRVVYSFYFINTDPGLALGIPMVISFIAPDSLKLQRFLMAIWLAAAIVFFVLFFPVHPLDFG
ncbi:MAG: glycosyltransferase family 39 protein [Nitrososphaerales archaeon]